MKNTDKILIGIVIGIVLLVMVAFVITLTKPAEVYQPEDTPEGVVHNYLLALKIEDYERAHGYLSPELPFYPESVDAFIIDVRDSYSFPRDNSTLTIQPELVRSDLAIVKVTETYFTGINLFGDSQYSNNFEMTLKKVGESWKISDGEGYRSYFDKNWKTD